MLTKKTKYALKALIHLAAQDPERTVLIAEIARDENVPHKFLEMILLELKRQGILESRKGPGGGYRLGRPPGQISLGRVIRLMDGPLAPLPCVSETAYRRCEDCNDENTCEIRRVMKMVRDETARILDGTTLADVISGGRS
jgi:Rrf2 family protein